MTEQKPKSILVCEACNTKPWVEQWENPGLVLVCECMKWQSVKTNTTLPTGWSG